MTAANRRTSLPSLSLLCLKEVAFIFFSRARSPLKIQRGLRRMQQPSQLRKYF